MISLTGLKVVVTRPAPYGQTLSEHLQTFGATVLYLPTIIIHPCLQNVPSTPPTDLIFTSQAAVQYAPPILNTAQVYAIGPATAAALKEKGIANVITQPAGGDSEQLLSHTSLQSVSGRHFWIVAGRHGRALLETQLLAKGATVNKVIVYERRCPPSLDEEASSAFLQAHVVVITSVDAFRHLTHMIGPVLMPALSQKIICVPSPRVAAAIERLGFIPQIIQAKSAQHQCITEALYVLSQQLNSGH